MNERDEGRSRYRKGGMEEWLMDLRGTGESTIEWIDLDG